MLPFLDAVLLISMLQKALRFPSKGPQHVFKAKLDFYLLLASFNHSDGGGKGNSTGKDERH